MNKKLSFLVLAGFIAVTLLLTACTPNRPDEAEGIGVEGSDEKAEKPESLTIWANDEEKQLKAIAEIAARYEAEKGIKVNVDTVSILDQTQAPSLAGPEIN